MQTIAYLTMLLNHMFNIEWVGVALPIFCYLIVKGLKRTHSKEWYIIRVLAIGAISQIWWPFKTDCYIVNDLFTIGLTMLAIEETLLGNILKIIMYVSWFNGVTAIEPLYLMMFSKYGKKYFYFGTLLMAIVSIPVYPYLLRWLMVPVVVELYEKKCLTWIPEMNYKLKYCIYPLHLYIMYLLR